MRKTLSILLVLAMVAGSLPLRAQDRTPPPSSPAPVPPKTPLCVKEVRFAGRYVELVNEDGSKVSFGQSTGGTTNGAVWKAPEGKRLRVEWVDRQAVVYVSDCRPDPVPTPVPTPTVKPSPDPTAKPSPGPTPTPSDPPSPPPGLCSWGKDVEGQCLPQPPALSCAALPDDPPGLPREGFGCDAKGGSGTGEIKVTALGPDGAPGTLRWAVDQANEQNRRINCAQGMLDKARAFFGVGPDALEGTIVLDSPLFLRKPYLTLDLSACNVTVKPSKPGQNAIVVKPGHNIIVFGVRVEGFFKGSNPNWIPPNDASLLSLDGSGIPTRYSWDDQWDTKDPLLRKMVRNSIFANNTLTGCEDDCLAGWEGVRDSSFLENMINGFHPTTSGAGGVPLDPGRERLRNFYGYNLWWESGERQVKAREETYWLVYAGNMVWHWTEYVYKSWRTGLPETNWPNGLELSDDYRDEINYGWFLSNCFIGIPGSAHKQWGVMVGSKFGCDADGKHQPATDYKVCNPKMANSHWLFAGNQGDATEGATNPPGWVPPPLPFKPDVARPWTRVLAEVGVPLRNAAEQAVIDRVIADLGKCVAVR